MKKTSRREPVFCDVYVDDVYSITWNEKHVVHRDKEGKRYIRWCGRTYLDKNNHYISNYVSVTLSESLSYEQDETAE